MADPLDTDALPTVESDFGTVRLVVVSGPDTGSELPLSEGTHRIGHGAENDRVLTDSKVSRAHLLVEVKGGAVTLADAGSTNGSFVHGLRFTRISARPGVTVRLGNTELTLLAAGQRPLPVSERRRLGGLTGGSRPMRELFALIERVAATDVDVLIAGETGTGKEICAEAIHGAGNRASRPFVVCDLAAVTPTLVESELFGHVRGAFTGAVADRAGAFEQAHGGTLFLDEIGELPMDLQPRLLRALERRQIKRLGAGHYATLDVRVIAATHKDLAAEVKAGRFREDLFFRVAVVQLRMPPLRERLEDVSLLIDEILTAMGKPADSLDEETRRLFAGYDWPGNVRELRHAILRALSLGGDVAFLSPAATSRRGAPATADRPFKDAKERLLATFERDYLADLLRRCGNDITQAAREAGIHRVHLHRLLRKHGLGGKGEQE